MPVSLKMSHHLAEEGAWGGREKKKKKKRKKKRRKNRAGELVMAGEGVSDDGGMEDGDAECGGEGGEEGREAGQRLLLEGVQVMGEEGEDGTRECEEYAGQPLPLTDLLPRPHTSPTVQLNKYWSQRYRLFSRYDDGVCLDRGMMSL